MASSPPPHLPPKPELSTPPPSEPRQVYTPDSARQPGPAFRPSAAPSSRFDRDRDWDWERERDTRDRGRSYVPPRPDIRHDDRRPNDYGRRGPYSRDRSRDADRGRRDPSRDDGPYDSRRPPYPRSFGYQETRNTRFPPSRPRYRSPPPYRRRSRSPLGPSRRTSRSPPRRRYSPSPPPRRHSRSPRRTPPRRSRSRSPTRNRSPFSRRKSRSRSPRPQPEKSRLLQHYPPIGAPTSPRSHREPKSALHQSVQNQPHLPFKQEIPDLAAPPANEDDEVKAEPVESRRITGDEAVKEESTEVEDIKLEYSSTFIKVDSAPTELVPEATRASKSPAPVLQKPLSPNHAPFERVIVEPTQFFQSPVEEERKPQDTSRPTTSPPTPRQELSVETKLYFKEDKFTHSSPTPYLTHPNKYSPYSPRPPFKQEEKPPVPEYLKTSATSSTPQGAVQQEMLASTSASQSPRPIFSAQQPERTLSGDTSHVVRSPIVRSGGPRAVETAAAHELVARFRGTDKKESIHTEQEIFELGVAWQQRTRLEREDWALSHQIYKEMHELELAMMDLRAAQSRKKIAEGMLDKAKSGVLGIDAFPSSLVENEKNNIDVVMS